MGKLGFLHSGTHWRKLSSSEPQLFRLAHRRFGGEGAPPVKFLPKAIPVTFGSRKGHLTLRKVDIEALRIYRHGHCTLLALALHRLLGYDLVLFTKHYDGGMWFGHAAVKLPDGRFLDVAGIFKNEKEILAAYDFTAPAQVVSPEEFNSIVIYNEPTARDIFSFVPELEGLITYDFAKYLIKIHGLKTSR